MVVEPARYGFHLPERLLRWSAGLVPHPDHTFLLKVPPEVAFARKPELPVERIREQNSRYEAEIAHWGDNAVVDAGRTASEVSVALADEIVAKCERRSSARLARFRVAGWRSFPSALRARVFIGPGDTVRSALRMLHPYSRRGRVATALARMLPDYVARRAFGQRPDAASACALEACERIVRRRWSADAYALSVYRGTLGASGKWTVQVSDGGKVIAYAKVGLNVATGEALYREATMLAWLERQRLEGVAVPHMLDVERSDGCTALHLSAPACGWRDRPLELDGQDVRFLAAMTATGIRDIAVAELIERL